MVLHFYIPAECWCRVKVPHLQSGRGYLDRLKYSQAIPL